MRPTGVSSLARPDTTRALLRMRKSIKSLACAVISCGRCQTRYPMVCTCAARRSPLALLEERSVLPKGTKNSRSLQNTGTMQLLATNLILCISVACASTVQSLTFRGIGRVNHAARELKEDEAKFVTDPSANVKGKLPRCYYSVDNACLGPLLKDSPF